MNILASTNKKSTVKRTGMGVTDDLCMNARLL
jgi:hypothetical protein